MNNFVVNQDGFIIRSDLATKFISKFIYHIHRFRRFPAKVCLIRFSDDCDWPVINFKLHRTRYDNDFRAIFLDNTVRFEVIKHNYFGSQLMTFDVMQYEFRYADPMFADLLIMCVAAHLVPATGDKYIGGLSNASWLSSTFSKKSRLRHGLRLDNKPLVDLKAFAIRHPWHDEF